MLEIRNVKFERTQRSENRPDIYISEEEKKLRQILIPELRKHAIDINDFRNLYGGERVESDILNIGEIKEKIREGQTEEDRIIQKKSELLEPIIIHHTESHNWMGQEAMTVIASEFDDIKSGIDIIVEFEGKEESSPLRLGIDVTVSVTQPPFEKKMRKIKERMERNRLSNVRYFKSEIGEGFMGRLEDIPRVVVGVDYTQLRELTELFLNIQEAKNRLSFARKNNNMADEERWQKIVKRRKKEPDNHPVQIQILEEIKMQLEKYSDYASKLGKENLKETYCRVLNEINEILEEKKEMSLPVKFRYMDKSYSALKTVLEREFK